MSVFVLLSLLSITLCASNVIWPVVGLGKFGTTYSIGADTPEGDGAGVFMNLVWGGGPTATLTAYSATMGIGHIWFQTEAGTPINDHAVTSSEPFLNAFTAEEGSIALTLNKVFYLGFYLESSTAIYGWASLVWDGTELRLTDSAYETTGVGIYAGTYEAIPEPTTVCLLAVGCASLLLRRLARQLFS